ncbi:MAG: hypothetical protein WC404_00115 [Candidatus Omnitrophota bacterium]|jgi:hypothetical protein
MARKRQIDPVFPFEKEIAALSIPARYLYILSWCQMDDTNGVLPYDSFFLKRQIFPEENIDVEALLQELMSQKRLLPFEAEGKKWLWCPNLLKHQVINHVSKKKYPDPPKILKEHYHSATLPLPKSESNRVSELSRVESKSKCDNLLLLLTGLDLTAKDQSEVLNTWCGGLKARTRCYSYVKCEQQLKEIIAKVKKAKPEKPALYFKKAVNNFITGD